MCKISLPSTRPKEDLGKETSPTTQVLKRQGNNSPYFNQRNPSVSREIQERKKALHRTNKTYISDTSVHLAEKITAKLLFFRTSKKGTKLSIFWLFLHKYFYFGSSCSMLLSEHGSPEVSLGPASWKLLLSFVIFNTELTPVKWN